MQYQVKLKADSRGGGEDLKLLEYVGCRQEVDIFQFYFFLKILQLTSD
jgi:hypothetical protein